MGRCGRQADGTAGLPPAPEITVRPGTYVSCHNRKCPSRIYLLGYCFIRVRPQHSARISSLRPPRA